MTVRVAPMSSGGGRGTGVKMSLCKMFLKGPTRLEQKTPKTKKGGVLASVTCASEKIAEASIAGRWERACTGNTRLHDVRTGTKIAA